MSNRGRRLQEACNRLSEVMFGRAMERITEAFAAWAIVIAVLMLLITITDALLWSK